ncbi:MAG TPA: winged helix-turn-helix domain-containing protein [Streptosporangiaceae bacterium]|nr:winged helix-turn-helix domain-containing protein [Streptosporangiaceae bacterium]
MEYRLLGPLEIVSDDGLLEIRSARQRIVLPMLLFHANRVVPLDRLVDAVWDIYPPATARSQIQTCISALRRLLGAIADDQILTHPAGYGIRVSDGGLDITTFER